MTDAFAAPPGDPPMLLDGDVLRATDELMVRLRAKVARDGEPIDSEVMLCIGMLTADLICLAVRYSVLIDEGLCARLTRFLDAWRQTVIDGPLSDPGTPTFVEIRHAWIFYDDAATDVTTFIEDALGEAANP